MIDQLTNAIFAVRMKPVTMATSTKRDFSLPAALMRTARILLAPSIDCTPQIKVLQRIVTTVNLDKIQCVTYPSYTA